MPLEVVNLIGFMTGCELSANLYDIHHCRVYSKKFLMLDRGTVRNMWSFIPKINLRNFVYLVGFHYKNLYKLSSNFCIFDKRQWHRTYFRPVIVLGTLSVQPPRIQDHQRRNEVECGLYPWQTRDKYSSVILSNKSFHIITVENLHQQRLSSPVTVSDLKRILKAKSFHSLKIFSFCLL